VAAKPFAHDRCRVILRDQLPRRNRHERIRPGNEAGLVPIDLRLQRELDRGGNVPRIDVAPEVRGARRRVGPQRLQLRGERLRRVDPGKAQADDVEPAPAREPGGEFLAGELGERVGILRQQRVRLVYRDVFGRDRPLKKGKAEHGHARGHDDAVDLERRCRLQHIERAHHVRAKDDLRHVERRPGDRREMDDSLGVLHATVDLTQIGQIGSPEGGGSVGRHEIDVGQIVALRDQVGDYRPPRQPAATRDHDPHQLPHTSPGGDPWLFSATRLIVTRFPVRLVHR
jgi:hypothetical protein